MAAAADRVLGKAEAVLQIVEERLQSVDQLINTLQQYERRLSMATPDIEALRTIVPDIQDTIATLRTTQWMTSTELARHLRCNPETVRRWYRDGMIPGHRFGDLDNIRFDVREVDRAIRRREIGEMEELTN